MKVNRDVLITAIIKQQDAFFQLLDYIDNHDGSLEIPESLYINLYNRLICSDPDDRIHYQLSESSLIENGIFIHNDKHTGKITVERIIVDLLRFLDIKRTKELTHADFEHMRARLVSACEYVQSQPAGSQSYVDAMSNFNLLVSEIHSKIKENVNGLINQVDNIALDYKNYDAGNSSVSVFDLYERVSTLYNRYVIPCYEFINPKMEMIRTQTFSKSMDRLIAYHATDVDRLDVANIIQFRKTAITSYYKDIAALARKLEQFSNHLEKDRVYFLAIEGAYSNLIHSIIPLRHGQKRNKYLTSSAEVFSHHTALDGLTNQRAKFSSKFNWHYEKTQLRFKEYLNLLLQKSIKPKVIALKPLSGYFEPEQERQILISRLLSNVKMPEQVEDIHLFIYEILVAKLPDFQLIDILYGIEELIPMYDADEFYSEFSKNRITDDLYFLNYVVISFKGNKSHV